MSKRKGDITPFQARILWDEQHEEAESAARYATRQAEINRLRGEIRDQSMKKWWNK